MILFDGTELSWNSPSLLFWLLVGSWLLFMVVVLRKIASTLQSSALLLVALWIFWGFGYETVARRLYSQVEGTVISRREVTYPLAPARYSTEYVLRGSDGQNHGYIAGPTDASLPRSIPVGTNVRKLRWHWSFEENGEVIDNFGWLFYGVILAMGIACLVWSLMLRSQESRLLQ